MENSLKKQEQVNKHGRIKSLGDEAEMSALM